jgi:hypothetical protein
MHPVLRILLRFFPLLALGCSPAIPVRGAGHCDPPAHATLPFEPDARPPLAAPRDEHLAALLGLRSVLVERRAGELSIESRMRVLERIELARLAVAASSAELTCESERADQTADYLGQRASGTVQALTVSSIVAAAATGTASVLLSTNNASNVQQDVVAIGGGVITGGLGLGSLWVHPQINYAHPRNLLAEIWAGPPTATLYSPFVWAYLTRPEFSNSQEHSIRDNIKDRWRRYQRIERSAGEKETLLGAGGLYDVSMLHTRSQMLDEVEAEVLLVNQDLESLIAELVH